MKLLLAHFVYASFSIRKWFVVRYICQEIIKRKRRKSPSSHHPHPHCVCCGDFSCCHASHGPSWQRKDRINEYYWDKTSCTGQSGDVDPFSIHTFYTFKCLFYYRCIWVCIFQWEYTSEISKVFTSVAQQTLFLQSKGFYRGLCSYNS